MKRIAILIPTLFLSSEALAIERYQTDSMSCSSVAAAVDRDGAAILRYRAPNNPSLQLYDRYVRDDRFCSRTQRARPVSVPPAIQQVARSGNACASAGRETARRAGGAASGESRQRQR